MDGEEISASPNKATTLEPGGGEGGGAFQPSLPPRLF